MDQTERLFLKELWRQAAATLAARAGAAWAEADWPAVWRWGDEAAAEAAQAGQLAQLAGSLAGKAEGEALLTTARLPNVLATIERSGDVRDATRLRSTHERFHPLRPLAPTKEFLRLGAAETAAADEATGYNDLWNGLKQALSALHPDDVTSVTAALKRFTWAVPAAATDAGAAESLYEQTRTAAALGVCWRRAGWPLDEPLSARREQRLGWLVKGDLSGVQDFLYLLTSAGAARGLRGRSFYLQLLTETLAEWVLRRWAATPPTNLIYVGGGHFYLLLPVGGADDEAQWRKLQSELAEKLWDAHHGDLGCTLARVELRVEDLTRLAERWTALAQAASAQKERKWAELGDTMFARLFTPQQRGATAEEMCQVCQHDFDEDRDGRPEEDGARKCSRCRGFEELGRDLRDVQHLVRFRVAETSVTSDIDWQAILGSFGQRVKLVHDGEPMPEAPAGTESIIVERVNEWWQPGEQERFESSGYATQYGWRWLADATPRKGDDDDAIAEFSDLAEAAQGAPWLGVLRMDVDSLGEVLRDGLQGAATLARLSTLSETLRLYFEGWVAQLCCEYNGSETKRDAVYLIYAGGDDLFAVGAWSVLPRLARRIHDDFAEFVGGQHVTVSAGIAIEHAKYPLYQFAADAGEVLDASAKQLRKEKDAIAFLGVACAWERFAEVEYWQAKLVEMLSAASQPLPRGFLTRLGEIYASYSENARRQLALAAGASVMREQVAEQIHYARWQWRLVYQLSQAGERNTAHAVQIKALQEALVRDDGLIGLLHVPVRWAELQTRNTQTNE